MDALFKRLAGAILLALVLGACVSLQPYHTTQAPLPAADGSTPPPAPPAPLPPCAPGAACLAFAEFDEFGNPFNHRQLLDTVARARQVAGGGGIVIVFVHGWHHNAHPDDSNLAAFNAVLARAAALDALSGGQHPILGIYVGWRGESIDSHSALTKLPSLLTFWERKNTAHAVGNGDVFELFARLTALRKEFAASRLVMIGHSFGGAVLYSALSHKLIEQILVDHGLAAARKGFATAARPWDLVVLLNPAFEAMRLRPQYELARLHEYADDQAPHLMVLTTQADAATGVAFPLGRAVSTLFDSYADQASGAMNRTAAGHYLPHITHQLTLSPSCTRAVVAPAAVNLAELERPRSYCFNDPHALPPGASPLLLSRCDAAGDCRDVAGEHYIQRGRVSEGKTPFHLPLMNIRTTRAVMSGHNDIWNETTQSFVTQLVAKAVTDAGIIPTSIDGPPGGSAK